MKLDFWNQLFFWITIIFTIRAWLDHRKDIVKDKVKITVNGKEYYAKHITVKNGFMFLDGRYIGPDDIESIVIEDD